MNRFLHQAKRRAPATAAMVGGAVLFELLVETWAGLSHLTTGSPMAFRGILLELPGSIWFCCLIALEAIFASSGDANQAKRVAVYEFFWSILGLALALWALMNVPESSLSNWQYWVALGCVCVAFGFIGLRDFGRPREMLGFVGSDLRLLIRNRIAWATFAVAGLLVLFAPSADAVPSRREAPLKGQALIEWYDRQPRTTIPEQYIKTPIVVAIFVDYECPACLGALQVMQPLWDELASKFADVVSVIQFDFPLERECNSGIGSDGIGIPNLHSASCEAAAVMRLARASKEVYGPLALERWIWANQTTMKGDDVLQAAREHLGIYDLARRYPALLDAVRADVAVGLGVGVRATPRYWINGVLTAPRPVNDLRLIILHELQRLGYAAASAGYRTGPKAPAAALGAGESKDR